MFLIQACVIVGLIPPTVFYQGGVPYQFVYAKDFEGYFERRH